MTRRFRKHFFTFFFFSFLSLSVSSTHLAFLLVHRCSASSGYFCSTPEYDVDGKFRQGSYPSTSRMRDRTGRGTSGYFAWCVGK
ncbi:hypothetical protein SODALDRAFT_330785 [Sodiomyces alkalinus F11]|uniref:Secreted protein n=1 Tax=Sodiomyces alkalinus (strain CBS 110278 / VKM F-3762 / F11) TaxID=1314773 RepID=A0A3N2Q2R7_SODAK|nr:hypothetical protein SODALDRAFT_330785 [Sodiomyces alkalinus F11]ROT41064.1 hypothetical protein SODALDRAFT_330785 [Sodiomyces alkalinus F11]